MVTEDFEAAIDNAENILKKENPLERTEANAYSSVIHASFERVKAMRKKGFSFVQICKAYEKSGLLPGNSRAGSFRQAFQRENIRRLKERELKKLVVDGKDGDGKEQKTAVAAGEDKSGKETNVESADAEREREKERIRRLTGTVVDTGLGKIIKHTDGSFEY
jgi:hypothetical protein